MGETGGGLAVVVQQSCSEAMLRILRGGLSVAGEQSIKRGKAPAATIHGLAGGLARNALGEYKKKNEVSDVLASKSAKEAAARAYLEKKSGVTPKAGDIAAPQSAQSVEATIAAAVASGAMDNLQGQGEPLADRSAHVGSAEDIIQRLKSEGARPRSIVAKEAMEALRSKAAKAIEAAPESPNAKLAHSELVESVQAYNSAVLADKEAMGAAWPLEAKTLPRWPLTV